MKASFRAVFLLAVLAAASASSNRATAMEDEAPNGNLADSECCRTPCDDTSRTCCIATSSTPPGNPPSTCLASSQCCDGFCDTGVENSGNGGATGRPGDLSCKIVCFSAKTLVRTLESPQPIPIEDLKTGDHVQCLDTNEDMRLPTTVKYCEVMNWLHARTDAVVYYRRIHFNRPGAAPRSLTVSPTHYALRLTSPEVVEGRTAARVHDFGKFENVPAAVVKPGDKLAVLVDESDASAGFTAALVTSVESLDITGFYTPALESPYIIADGAVTPLYVDFKDITGAPEGMQGAHIAALQYQHAPALMTRLHPVGTSGKAAAQKGEVVPIAEGEGLVPIWRSKEPFQAAGKAINFPALRDWFLPRYKAWKTDPTKAITVEEVAAVMGSESTWLEAPPKPSKLERVVTLERGAI